MATLLFADLVGSTALGGGQDPERTRAMLDRFYDSMAGEIASVGGTVEKFIGDAVMAAFGAPRALEDHAERALHAALRMRARLAETFGGALALRIGVNTGEVAVGRPREGSSFVTGDPVNVTARLEQAAKPGEILVGEATVSLVGTAFEFDDRVTIEAKGKPEGVACRRLRRAVARTRPRGVVALRRAFVGRDPEMAIVEEAYSNTVGNRTPRLVTILGDAGVGKSTLVGELCARMRSSEPAPALCTGRCLAYGRGITYWPFGEILRAHFGLLESDAPDVVLERLGDRHILALSLGLDVAGDLHPLVAQERLHTVWVKLIDEMAAVGPVVILLEDLHWAEQPMLDLVQRIRREASGPVLLLATARPEFLERRPGWRSGTSTEESPVIRLEPLSEKDTDLMLREVLVSTVPPALHEIVVNHAEGNPFFVEELLAMLIDRGSLVRRGGEWEVAELPPDSSIPSSVHALVAARIDMLEAREKAGLQGASVIGRVFWPRPVRELIESEDPDYSLLEEREFVRKRHESSMEDDIEYWFKHIVTKEVAYGTLSKASRLRLHARFADWLEGYGTGRDDFVPLLAHHYAESVRPDSVDLAWGDDPAEVARLRAKAVWWLRRAAELAVARYDIDGTLALLHQALELEALPRAQAEMWKLVGRAHALRYEGDAFWAALDHAIQLSDDTALTAELDAELAFLTTTRFGMWLRKPDLSLVDGWIDSALELAGSRSAARAKALIARVFWHDTDARSAGDAAEAIAIAERLDDIQIRSFALAAGSYAALAVGDLAMANDYAQQRIRLIPDIADADHRHDVYKSAMDPAMALGDVDEVIRLERLVRESTAELSPHHRLHGVAFTVMAREYSGRWEAIRDLGPSIEETVRANEATPCMLNERTLLAAALANAVLGDFEEAARLERIADAIGMEGYELWFGPVRAALAAERGDHAEVERLLSTFPREKYGFGDALALAQRLTALTTIGARDLVEAEAPPLVRPNTYLEPFALRALGYVRRDTELLRRAADRFQEMGLEWHAARTRALAQTL
ncbi:MAG: ATP-binding protein [Actinomycetota bacterium]